MSRNVLGSIKEEEGIAGRGEFQGEVGMAGHRVTPGASSGQAGRQFAVGLDKSTMLPKKCSVVAR